MFRFLINNFHNWIWHNRTIIFQICNELILDWDSISWLYMFYQIYNQFTLFSLKDFSWAATGYFNLKLITIYTFYWDIWWNQLHQNISFRLLFWFINKKTTNVFCQSKSRYPGNYIIIFINKVTNSINLQIWDKLKIFTYFKTYFLWFVIFR